MEIYIMEKQLVFIYLTLESRDNIQKQGKKHRTCRRQNGNHRRWSRVATAAQDDDVVDVYGELGPPAAIVQFIVYTNLSQLILSKIYSILS